MADIEMNYYNGSTYEVLYPYVNLSNSTGSLNISSRTTGTPPLNRGGTAGTSATSGLYNLINGCSTVTNTGLTTGDYFPLQDVSASNAKKITVNNLINYLESNLDIGGSTSITSGTYQGTGSNQTVTVNTSIQLKVFFFISRWHVYRRKSSYS